MFYFPINVAMYSSDEEYEIARKVPKRNIKLSKSNKVPLHVHRFAERCGLYDMSMPLKIRIQDFEEYCQEKNYSQVYVSRMYSDLIRYRIIPYDYEISTYQFNHNTQKRNLSNEDGEKLMLGANEYVDLMISDSKPFNYAYIYTYLVGVYALRVEEMRRLIVSDLHLLSSGIAPEIKLKGQIKTWIPLFSNKLKHKSSTIYNYLISNNVPETRQVFNRSANTINSQLKQMYLEILGKYPPLGFGTHTFRYYLAKRSEKLGSVLLANRLLNHSKIGTTQKYLKSGINNHTETLQTVFNSTFAPLK